MSGGRWRDKTRYGFPPERDRFERFPVDVPWDVPISDLANFWLKIRADGQTTAYPLRLMAAEQGWGRTLREIVPKLRSKAGEAPTSVILVAEGGMEFRRTHNVEGRYHVLLGPGPEFRE